MQYAKRYITYIFIYKAIDKYKTNLTHNINAIRKHCKNMFGIYIYIYIYIYMYVCMYVCIYI